MQVADSGSFSRAAKQLYLTQPTVSAHISSLEKELDVRLFVRNTKEVSLSEDGEILFQYAKQIIELERKIEDTFCVKQEDESRPITIAASTIPAQYLLPKILARFVEKYPAEQFRITETDSSDVVEQIVKHTVDIGFTGTVLEKKHCKYIPFYRDELTVITPNNEKFRRIMETNTDLEWIRKEAVILREEGSGTRKEAEKQLRNLGIAPDELNIVASIGNQETIKKSVQNGIAISVISRLAAEEEVAAGKLLSFAIPTGDGGRDLNVVYNKNFHLTHSAERFVKTVKEIYGKKR